MAFQKTLPRDWVIGNTRLLQTANGDRSQSRTARGTNVEVTRATTSDLQRTSRDVQDVLSRRIDEVNRRKQDLQHCNQELFLEISYLEEHKDKTTKALQSTELPLEISTQCQQWRDGRIGKDLVDDDVDAELAKEQQLLRSIRQALQQSVRDCEGQLRLLRAAKYKIDADIQDKETAEGIDMSCASLNTTHRDITRNNTWTPDDHEGMEPHEWDAFTLENIAQATRERESSVLLRSTIDTLLQKHADEQLTQANAVDDAFNRRIAEISSAKHAFETSLSETRTELEELGQSLAGMDRAISDNDAPLKLAETRLERRRARPNVELVRDPVHHELVAEVQQILAANEQLKGTKAAAEKAHRALVVAQNELEEDIRVKTNSLNIDNQCMRRRQHYKYRPT
eukprot:m.1274901 g.1274901  ORF g.1274901 m.1274901 type:complete len:397 (-) comp24759_c0_seq5:212-1402(-)